MSIRFDAAADRLTYTGSIPVPTGGLTITCWVKIVNDRNDFSAWFRVYTGAFGTVITSETDGDGTSGNNYFTAGGSASNGVAMGTGVWRAVAISHDTGTTGKAYVRVGTLTTVASATVGSGTPAGICIGGRDSGDSAEWFDGEIAQVRIWSAELTQTQIEAEWASSTPVISANAYANWPLGTATDLVDTVAARTLTTPNGAGQTTGTDGPPNTAAVSLPRMAPPGRIAPGGLWRPIIGDTAVSAQADASPTAGLGSANVTGLDATVTVSPAAGLGSANATSQAPTPNVSPTAGLASANASALAPTVSISVNAGLASANATGQAPTPNVSANAGLASANATGLAPTLTNASNSTAGLGSANATAQAPTATVSPAAGLGSANATALNPTVTISVTAGLASANATGLDATTSSAGAGSAVAGAGSANATALGPTVTVSTTAGLGSAQATALSPTVTVSPNAGLATANATGRDATTSSASGTSASSGLGSANATALDPTVVVSPVAGLASAGATALAPTVASGSAGDVSTTAGLGSALARAWNPTVTIQNARPNAGWYELLGVLRSGRVVDDVERFDCPRCGVRYDVNTHGGLGCRFDGFRPDRTLAGAGGSGRRDWGGLNAALDDTPTPARRDYLPGWGPTE